LIYPATDSAADTASYRENADGYLLTTAAVRHFWRLYLPTEEDGQNPYAFPLRARDLRRVPPALVITAEFHALRDEGEAYGARLKEAGVPVEIKRYNGMIHGFFSLGHVMAQGKQAIVDAAAALRAALA